MPYVSLEDLLEELIDAEEADDWEEVEELEIEIDRRTRKCDAQIAAEQGRGCGWHCP